MGGCFLPPIARCWKPSRGVLCLMRTMARVQPWTSWRALKHGSRRHLPERVRDLELALTMLGSRAADFSSRGMTAPFPRLSAERQDTLLRRWSTSPVTVARTVYQGVRRLVLTVYYTTPESFEETGYLGPLYLRGPAYPWEGPIPDHAAPNAGEPVARGAVVPSATRDGVPSGVSPDSPSCAQCHADVVRLTADVIVIGSGAGGAVAAARLAELGRDVLLLEEGSLVGADELTECEGDMTARLYAESGMRATDDLSFVLLQGAAVGGGTLVNWMITFRAPDFVLDEWADRFGITGFSPAEHGAAVRPRRAGDTRHAGAGRRPLARKPHSPRRRTAARMASQRPGASTREAAFVRVSAAKAAGTARSRASTACTFRARSRQARGSSPTRAWIALR